MGHNNFAADNCPDAIMERDVARNDATPSSFCAFSKFPLEIQTMVLVTAIDGDNARMLLFISVCRYWREIIIGLPVLWGDLVLTRRTMQEKIDIWLARSNGNLSKLKVDDSFSLTYHPKALANVSDDMWSSLNELTLIDLGNVEPLIFCGVFKCLRLQSLTLHVRSMPSRVVHALNDMDSSRLRKLALRVAYLDGPLSIWTFTTLESLALAGDYSNGDLLGLLKHNPALESLVLESTFYRQISPSVVYTRSTRIEFPSLRHLEILYLSRLDEALMKIMHLPNLQLLTLKEAYLDRRSGLLESLRLPSLMELRLLEPEFDAVDLVSLLQTLSALVTLELSSCTTVNGDENYILGALARRHVAETAQDFGGFICPRLQHVDLSGSKRLEPRSVVDFVKARLQTQPTRSATDTSPGGETQNLPLPILSLNLNGCSGIDADTESWLQANVRHFRCKQE